MYRNYFNNDSYLKGKFIKYAVLVDSKNNLKVIPYNFDYLTFLFGGVTYLFRKEILKGVALLFTQALSIYLLGVPIGIILSFIITFIVSIFSGKYYVSNLIKEGALSFDEYEENGYSHEYDENVVLSHSDEKRGNIMIYDYKYSVQRQNTIFYCAGLFVAVSIILLTGFKMRLDNNTEYKSVVTKKTESGTTNGENVEISNEFVLLLADDKNIESFALVNFDKDKDKVDCNYYYGQTLVKQGDSSISISKVFEDKGIIPEDILKKYFKIDKDISQIKVDINKLEEIIPKVKDNSIEEKYKEILINSTKLDDEKYDQIIKDASILDKVNNEVEENYLNYDAALEYKNKVESSKETFEIKKGDYYEIALSSIASKEAIKALGDSIKEDTLYYFDYSDLDCNPLVKKIKEKNKELKTAKKVATKEDANSNVNDNKNINIANKTEQSSHNNYNVNNNNNTNYNKPTKPTKPMNQTTSQGSVNNTGNGNSGANNQGNSSNGSNWDVGNSENTGSSGGDIEDDKNESNGSDTEVNPDSGSEDINQDKEDEVETDN